MLLWVNVLYIEKKKISNFRRFEDILFLAVSGSVYGGMYLFILQLQEAGEKKTALKEGFSSGKGDPSP